MTDILTTQNEFVLPTSTTPVSDISSDSGTSLNSPVDLQRNVSSESIFSNSSDSKISNDKYENGTYFNPEDEFILNEDDRVAYSVRYPQIHHYYLIQQALHWEDHKVKFSPVDRTDWDTKLNDNERYFLKHILAFFAASDMIVNENLAQRFSCEVKLIEANAAYMQQMAMEVVHSIVYANLITEYIKDKEEAKKLLNAVKTFPIITAKANWCKRWIQSKRPFCERLAAFAIVEGVFFAGSFAAIFWMAEKGLLPALRTANQYIARDESVHVLFANELYHLLKVKTPIHILTKMFTEAVELETEFIVSSIPCNMVGMNAKDMTTYIKFTANRLFKMLTKTDLFPNIANPFPFMDRIMLENKANFFEKEVTNYSKADYSNADEDPFSDI